MRLSVYLWSTILAADQNDQRRLKIPMSGSHPRDSATVGLGCGLGLWHILVSPQGDFTVQPGES